MNNIASGLYLSLLYTSHLLKNKSMKKYFFYVLLLSGTSACKHSEHLSNQSVKAYEPVAAGEGYIGAYQKRPIKYLKFQGYLVKSDELLKLIKSNPDGQGKGYIRCCLARKSNGRLTMVLSGARENGDHYTIPAAGKGDIIQSIIPCPDCRTLTDKKVVQDNLLDNTGELTTGGR